MDCTTKEIKVDEQNTPTPDAPLEGAQAEGPGSEDLQEAPAAEEATPAADDDGDGDDDDEDDEED
jgi:hypothetical protein